ncbi:hypothetical protein AB0B28_08090 [Glycomyces sp. NPDC046736]|uniref:hypothetical protein n=1 Tax=Glycomyces sp. NPDC046736 TaxID=3155615 RepID=UPI003402E577
MDHTIPGTVDERRWRQRGHWGTWRDYVLDLGALDDGRWYVRQLAHDLVGPWRAEVYATEKDARTVAAAVLAAARPVLEAADYREI